MKIRIERLDAPGYKCSVCMDGEPIHGIAEALISIKPYRMPILTTEEVVFENGEPVVENDHIKVRYAIYCPEEFEMEA